MTASASAPPLSPDEAAALLQGCLSAADGHSGAVLAVSGGPDSVALMRLSATVAGGDAGGLVVATVDHGLRPQSRAEAEQVAAWAGECGLPHRILTWTERPRTRIQEAAREARYALLAAFAAESGRGRIVTGHTLDDQAETVVMRLLRGSGIAGLSGMRGETRRGETVLVRPFLAIRKARLVATCLSAGWPFLEDPSNGDPRFARARLRAGLMPALAREGLTPERAALLARRAGSAEEAVARRAEQVLSAIGRDGEAGLILDGAALLAEPDAVRLAVVARAIAAVLGGTGRPVRLERLEAVVLGEIVPALDEDRRLRRNVGGALIETRRGRHIAIAPEPPRGGD